MTAAIVALVLQGPTLTARLLAYWKGAFAAAHGRWQRVGRAGRGRGRDGARAGGAAGGGGAGRARRRICCRRAGCSPSGALRPDLARLSPAAGLGRAFGGAGGAAGRQGPAQGDAGGGARLADRAAVAGGPGGAGGGAGRAAGGGDGRRRRAARGAGRAGGAGAGRGRLPAGAAPPPGPPAHDARGGQARTQGIGGGSEPPRRAPAAAPRARWSNEWSPRSEKQTSSWSIRITSPSRFATTATGKRRPVVVARGERLLAERIKAVAREAGVPIFRDVTLARSLRDLPEGAEIPAALYEAVAEILAPSTP